MRPPTQLVLGYALEDAARGLGFLTDLGGEGFGARVHGGLPFGGWITGGLRALASAAGTSRTPARRSRTRRRCRGGPRGPGSPPCRPAWRRRARTPARRARRRSPARRRRAS